MNRAGRLKTDQLLQLIANWFMAAMSYHSLNFLLLRNGKSNCLFVRNRLFRYRLLNVDQDESFIESLSVRTALWLSEQRQSKCPSSHDAWVHNSAIHREQWDSHKCSADRIWFTFTEANRKAVGSRFGESKQHFFVSQSDTRLICSVRGSHSARHND